MLAGISWSVAKNFNDGNEIEVDNDEGADEKLVKRQASTVPLVTFTGLHMDPKGFTYWLFTDLELTDGTTSQNRKLLLDTGSSDTWLTTPSTTTGWTLVDSTLRSITYGFGSVSNIQMWTVPKVTIGSSSIANLRMGYVSNRPQFLDGLAADKMVSGIMGLGTAANAGLTSANSWENWCSTKAYTLTKLQKLEICKSLSVGSSANYTFLSGATRAIFAHSSTIAIGTASPISLTPANVLIDSGSGYIIVDDAVASSIATAMKTKWPISAIGRRDDAPEFESGKLKLVKRQSISNLGPGPYPALVGTLNTKFYRIACASGDVTITMGGIPYFIPSQAYVYRDNSTTTTGTCYSAFVGLDYNGFVNNDGTSTKFAIFGLPFLRSTSLFAYSVNHASRIVSFFNY